MTRKSVALVLSFCLLAHSAGVYADISQLMVDQEGNTIKFRRAGGQPLFNDVVNGIVAACNMSTNATQPNASYIETQYWSLVNYNYKYASYLSVFRLPNSTDDAVMNQTLNCSSLTAQSTIVGSYIDNNLGLLTYLILAIPIAMIGGALTVAFTKKYCCTTRNTAAAEIQLETVRNDASTSVAQLDSVTISVTPSDTISEVGLSTMSGSAAQSLDQSLGVAPSSG